MKKHSSFTIVTLIALLIFVLLIVLTLNRCIQPIYEFDEIPDLGLQTIEDVIQWVYWEIDWVSDNIHYPADEYWQSPAQTYIWRTGDCEDFAILALYLIHRDVGIDGRLILGYFYSSGHAWLYADGHFWEPQWNMIIDNDTRFRIQNSISYKDAIRRSTTTHKAIEETE